MTTADEYDDFMRDLAIDDLTPEEIERLQRQEIVLSVAILEEELTQCFDRMKYYGETPTREEIESLLSQTTRLKKLLP